MFKLFATLCLGIAMLSGYYPKEITVDKKDVATCYGKTPCNACSNCSQCKYCSGGGTCGKCEKKEQTYKTNAPQPVTTQCKAITRKEQDVNVLREVMGIVGSMGEEYL